MYFHLPELCRNKMMQAAPETTNPSTYNEILETEYDIMIAEVKRGDETLYQPKVVSKGTEYGVYFRTAPMSTLYSLLGNEGDKLGDHTKFNKPVDQACAADAHQGMRLCEREESHAAAHRQPEENHGDSPAAAQRSHGRSLQKR